MAEVKVCDICGEPIRNYGAFYRFKYGSVLRFREFTIGNGVPIDVCKDCIEQVKELRKAVIACQKQ